MGEDFPKRQTRVYDVVAFFPQNKKIGRESMLKSTHAGGMVISFFKTEIAMVMARLNNSSESGGGACCVCVSVIVIRRE